MTELTAQPATETPEHGEFDQQPFRRLRYFHGQMLTARDFQREQEYFREKLKLRMRCLLGYGVVCGLYVRPAAEHDHDDRATDQPAAPTAGDDHDQGGRARVLITSGLGVDCDGNELVVNGGCVIDLRQAAKGGGPTGGGTTLWIGIEHAERAVEPTRTVFTSSCADTSDCEYGYTEESYVVRVSAHAPPEDERCETCCSRCEHPVLWLARIDDVDWNCPVSADQIHLNVRRPFGRRVPTVITGVNWRHGHTYTVDEARRLLGTQHESGGLVVRFSDDIRVDSLAPGVVDVQVIEGGAGRNANTWYMGGRFEEPVGGEFTRQFRFRQTTRETLQDGDRVLITIRAAFLLDRCCHPVDGTHVGGRVPFIRRRHHADAAVSAGAGAEDNGDWPDPYPGADAKRRPETEPITGCALPPSGVGPWTSGTGAGGDVFESWFYITEGHR